MDRQAKPTPPRSTHCVSEPELLVAKLDNDRALAVALALTFPNPWSLVFVFVSQANEIHAWAHSRGKVSRWIEMFQETGFSNHRNTMLLTMSPRSRPILRDVGLAKTQS